MKISLIAVLLSTALAGCSTTSMMDPTAADSAAPKATATAPETQPAAQPAAAQSFAPERQTYALRDENATSRSFFGMAAVGYTGGGQTILPVTFVDESTGAAVGSSNIRAGSGAQLSAGAEYRFNRIFALQGSYGYQMDDAVGSDGSARFIRNPIEMIGFVNIYEGLRVGGGVRIVDKGRLRGEGTAQSLNVNLERATGALVEIEYLFSPHAGLSLRYARENYHLIQTDQTVGWPTSFSGNQTGVFINAYF